MALLYPVDRQISRESQQFGPATDSIQPAVFANGTKAAWWQPYKDWRFVSDFHVGLDISAPAGTPIVASESGIVVDSYFDSLNGGGHKVTVEIQPGVRYVSNHMQARSVALGQRVKRGQKLGTVGMTGWAGGNHDHFMVTLADEGHRAIMYNPRLYLPGGLRANSDRIRPLPAPPRLLQLNGAGINIRTSPDLDRGSANLYATSRQHGVFRNQRQIANLGYRFEHLGTITNEDGRWFRVRGLQHLLYIRANLMHDA